MTGDEIKTEVVNYWLAEYQNLGPAGLEAVMQRAGISAGHASLIAAFILALEESLTL